MKVYILEQIGRMGYDVEPKLYYAKLENAKKKLKQLYKKYKQNKDLEEISWDDKLSFKADVWYSMTSENGTEYDTDDIFVGIKAHNTED